MLSKSYKGKSPKEPTVKKLGSSCGETQAETQELFLQTHKVIWRIKLDPEHTGHFFQMPNKNLESQGKALELSISSLKKQRLTAMESFRMLSGL